MKKYEIVWQIRYFFPCIFIILFVGTIYRHDWSNYSLIRLDYTEIVIFIGELVVLFFALHLLFVRYEINNGHLIVYRLGIIKKAYNISEIQWICEDGIYSFFLGKFPVGIDFTVLNLSNGKKIKILGLKDPLKFIQDIRAQQST